MPKRLLLGLDLGSSGVKATLLDPDTATLVSTSAEVALWSDHPGWAEADPGQWWSAGVAAVQEIWSTSPYRGSDVAAISVAGMVPALVVSDAARRPLRRAMLQNDARATQEIRELRERLADVDLLGRTGSVLSQQSVAPSALWLSRHEADVWSAATYVQGSYDWFAGQLGATPHVEQNWAIESGLYDLELTVVPEVLEATAIAWPASLPVRRPGDVVGNISEAAARLFGLDTSTAIVVGGADHVFSAFGAGLLAPGDTLLKLGGAGDILAVSDHVVVDERLYLDAHPRAGYWLPNGCMATSGSLLRWEQSLLGGVDLTTLDSAAQEADPGALVTLPYFLGEKTPLHDPLLRGVIVGLHLGTTRGDIHRSFLESIAYGFRAHVEIFLERGIAVSDIRVTNGGSTSRLWREILASVLNRPLRSIVHHPGASYAAAVIAGRTLGILGDDDLASSLESGEIIAPDPAVTALYDERFEQFRALTLTTTDLSHQLARRTL